MKKRIVPIYGRLIVNFIIALVLIAIPTVVAIYVNTNDFKKAMVDYEYRINLENVEKSQSVVDSSMKNVELCMQGLGESDEIINALTYSDNEEYVSKAVSSLKGAVSSQQYIVDMQIYSKKSNLLIDASGTFAYADERGKEVVENGIKWLKLAQSYEGNNTLTSVSENGKIWISKSCYNENNLIGHIAIKIDLITMSESLFKSDTSFSEKDFFILNDYGEILYYNGATDIYKNVVEGMDCAIAILNADESETNPIEICGKRVTLFKVKSQQQPRWFFAVLDHYDISTMISNKIATIIKTTIGVIVLVCLISVAIITLVTYIPVFKIMKILTKNNGTEKRSEKIVLNETTYIINSILHSLQRVNETEKELENRINLLQKYQTTALQMQTSPHFLFNTLDTIRWSSLEEYGENNITYQMIEKLSMLYREYFRTDNIITTVRDELHILELYMSIINVRFKNQIFFQVNVPDELLDQNCIKICLQPIIENSLRHGLRPQHYKGGITISLTENDGVLRYCISDTGVGMSKSDIKRINSNLSSRASQSDEHIGFSNVNERIKLMYGDDYGVYIQEPEANSVGTKVCITFPKL